MHSPMNSKNFNLLGISAAEPKGAEGRGHQEEEEEEEEKEVEGEEEEEEGEGYQNAG